MKNTIRVHQFHGGIHPPENKKQSTGAPISLAPIPSRIVLPLQQHIGLPADPVVRVGQRVLKGQLVAEAIGRISANIHASISGTVVAIEPHPVPHMSGMKADCLIIESDGKDEWIEHQGLADYTKLPTQALIEYIRQSGIAGMGGAGFPTDVKLHLGDDHIVNTLIINAAECEPYITADDMLMRERADEIMGGIEIIAHLLKPLHIMVGIEDNKPQAIRALHAAMDNSALNLDIVITPTKYPSGGEKQLIKLLTGVEVPSGSIPADVGIVCQNVGTTSAIYRAVTHGEPLISRIITVTGQAAAHKQNYEVRLGTPLADLLNHSAVERQQLQRLIIGGPMMGITVTDEQIPVIKTTNCLIAGSIKEMPPQPPAQACIRCGMCEQVCPAELLPQQLYWFAKGKEFDKARHHNLFDCIECGACSYVCPSNIPLVQYYRFAKAEIRKEDDEQRKADHARQRFEARLARLERDKIEKEERRKQRAIDAAAAQAAKKDAALNQAPTASVSAAPEAGTPDLKQLKSNAAIARTKLKKAEKALNNAQDKGLDGIDTLKETLKQLQLKSAQAEKAYSDAQNAPAKAAAPVLDLKQLKSNAAIARTKLKKAEKQLANATASGEGDISALTAQVSLLQDKNIAAEKAYKAAESGPSNAAAAPIDTTELEADIAALQAKVDKATSAWQAAVASASPAADKMAAGVEKLTTKLKGLQDELSQARAALPASSATVDTTELEADIAALQGKVDKANSAWQAAVASASPAADKMAAGVEKLTTKLKGLQDELSQARAALPASSTTVDTTELEADIAALQGKVDKANGAWQAAVASASPAADKMAAGVEKLTTKLKGLQDELTQAKSRSEAAMPAAAPATAAPDLKALKQQVSIMRTKLKKAEKQLTELPEGADNAALMAEIDSLKARHDAAKALWDAAEADKIAAAAAQGVDLKQLKIDAAMARAAVTKAERALSKAEDDQPALEAELVTIRAQADKLNATLERFSD
ncbi:electron transport complex subunit RsxC [Amphritea sp. 1_MG-2023]|uniref:electron transport complex subunit RsxC n=1 Tax=Amphritea sp. 1_MG-2023 TaxID=3062670 RepID=UPI0026E209F3|nr:electron transport complex subunit RsxC [Amphritea sp. 1_MG-2023]MDO6564296.1 electron transport complex subunit RsxC [Amphritea sp. 1_MG-2023]